MMAQFSEPATRSRCRSAPPRGGLSRGKGRWAAAVSKAGALIGHSVRKTCPCFATRSASRPTVCDIEPLRRCRSAQQVDARSPHEAHQPFGGNPGSHRHRQFASGTSCGGAWRRAAATRRYECARCSAGEPSAGRRSGRWCRWAGAARAASRVRCRGPTVDGQFRAFRRHDCAKQRPTEIAFIRRERADSPL